MDETMTPTDLNRLLLGQIADKWTILILGAIWPKAGRRDSTLSSATSPASPRRA